MNNITRGVRKLSRPKDTSVLIQRGFNQKLRTKLAVTYHDGTAQILPISSKVAEVLIARGMAYQG